MNRPFFSIIVPVYKVERYLDQCITSVLSQTCGDFELILVDDGSPDNCGKICDDYSEKDGRITVIHQKNAGASAARNNGIRNIHGRYVIFLDSDDYWMHDGFLEAMQMRLTKRAFDVVSFNFRKLYERRVGEPYFAISSMNIDEDGVSFLSKNPIWIACPWNKVIKADLFANSGLFFVEGIIAEDIDWCARLARCAESFDYVDMTVVAYRQREDSVSHSLAPKDVACLEQNIAATEAIIESAQADEKGFLLAYLSYQVAVLLYNVLSLDRAVQGQYREKMKKHMSRLRYSNTKKTMLIFRCYRLLGYDLTVRLLSPVIRQGKRR